MIYGSASKLWLASVAAVYLGGGGVLGESSSSPVGGGAGGWSPMTPPSSSSSSFSLYQEMVLSIQGGDQNKNEEEGYVTMAHLMSGDETMAASSAGSYFLQEELYDEDELMEEDDDDDDDDEDDDDGHSSMLSNAFLSRGQYRYAAATKPTKQEHRVRVSAHGDHCDSSRPSSNSVTRALSMRGGGAASSTKDVVMSLLTNKEFGRKLMVSALVTIMYETVLGHLLEFLKIVMQTAPEGTTYKDVLSNITAEKGLAGIWDGFVPWGVVQSIFKGGVFGLAHAVAASMLLPLSNDGTLPKQLALTLAGGIAGGFQGFVLSPLLLLKTRVMTNPVFREQMSLLRTTLLSLRLGLDVVHNEGFPALMKGSNVFALKRVFDWATRFYFADVFSKIILQFYAIAALTPAQKISADLLGGTASTLVTLPLDVLVAKTQDAKKAGQKTSAWDMLTQDYKEGGWNGLYKANMRGFEARLAHVCFTTVAMKTGVGIMYEALYGPKQ